MLWYCYTSSLCIELSATAHPTAIMSAAAPSVDVLIALRSSISRSPRCPHLHHRPRTNLPTRPFHSTSPAHQKRKPKHKNYTKEELDRLAEDRAKQYPTYTAEERTALAQKYTPVQMSAIEAGEEAISSEDLAEQGALRRDFLMPQYLDDFSRIEKTIDKKIEKLRGENQDYENRPDFAQMPSHAEMASGMDSRSMWENPAAWRDWDSTEGPGEDKTAHNKTVQENMGIWEESEGPNGERKWEFKWKPEKLDVLAQEEFANTTEGRAIMTPALSKKFADDSMADVSKDLGIADDTAADVARQLDASRRDIIVTGDTPARIDWDKQLDQDEEDRERYEAGLPMIEREEDKPYSPPDYPPEYEAALPDYKNNPKFKAIRDRIALTRMPQHWSFGSSEQGRMEEKLIGDTLADVAPEVPKIEDPTVSWGRTEEEGDEKDETGGLEDEALEAYQRLGRLLGQSVPQLLAYRAKTLVSHRVVNQTRLGKIQSQYTLCVAGNGNGLLGIGEGKAAEGDEAVRIGRLNAIRSMVPILRYENRTIYGDIKAKVGASVVELGARRPGFGVRTNAIIFEIARCAGLFDLSARCPRSRNPVSLISSLAGV